MPYLSYRNNEKIKLKNHNNILKTLFPNIVQWKNIRLKLSRKPNNRVASKENSFLCHIPQRSSCQLSFMQSLRGPSTFHLGPRGVPKAESRHVCDKGEGPEVAPKFLLTFQWQQFKLCSLRKPARKTGKKGRTNFGRQQEI